MNLGLTNCQSRIYLALVQNGRCSADKLSKISKVTRQDIYRILPKLQEIGLARKIVNVPVEWEATSLKEGLTLLMDSQNKRHLRLQTQITELLDSFIVPNKTMDLDNGPDFVIIPKGQQQQNWWVEKIEKTKTSWDGFTVFEGFGQGIHLFEEYFQRALDRGVKFRHLFFTTGEVDLERRKRLTKVSPTFEHANFRERYLASTSNFVGMVFDKKEACICTQTVGSTKSRKPTTGPFLWSKNEAFVGILLNYFDLLWNQAQEIDPK
jgi:sugar-specific transcriptional regulator TrmB